MPPIIINIPLASLVAINANQLTRESVIGLAHRASEEVAREVHIVVTDLVDGSDTVEVATIELNSAPDGSWRLQYVSHPAQSCGLTASISPCKSDFAAFIHLHKHNRQLRALTPFCAQDLEDEELGPLAMLSLRADNSAPVVPTKADLVQLVAMADIKSARYR